MRKNSGFMINKKLKEADPQEIKARFVWWLHPSAILFLVLIPIYILAWWSGVRTDGMVSTAKGFYFFYDDVAWLGLAGLIVLAVGTLSPISAKKPSNQREYVSPKLLLVLGSTALLGYLVLFQDIFLNPGKMLDAIKNTSSITFAIAGTARKGAGISSLAQLGLAFLVLYGHTIWTGGRHLLNKWHHRVFYMILAAVVLRAFGLGERVALIEALTALGFVWVVFADIKSNFIRKSVNFLPVIASFGVVGLFAAAEYFRSWTSFYGDKGIPFWEFIMQRLTNYYFAALNTGAGRLTMLDWPTYTFENILRWVHKLPVIGPIFSYYVGLEPDTYLILYGDVEFNNPSGLFSIFYDVGVLGGFLLLFFLGVLSKYIYSVWQNSSHLLGCFYFVFLMTFLELMRYFYLGDSRSFMVVWGLIIPLFFKVRSE
jgi:oligosaccharide repeat unit polymerase